MEDTGQEDLELQQLTSTITNEVGILYSVL